MLFKKIRKDFGPLRVRLKTPKGVQFRRVCQKSRKLKLRAERENFTKILRVFHSTTDLDYMVTQLYEEESFSLMLNLEAHALEERK